MSRLVARAENWERVYQALENVNFAAFDYAAIKQSLLDYLKLYYPEVFNDFIESDELIAIIETFAYIGEILAYRYDVDARENLLSVAQRRESLLRLAKTLSYSATRPVPARGLVKITSVSTSESIIDANGTNLANRTIFWNDTTNSNWKSQFIAVINRVLDQGFGSVAPADRFQIQDELFELYRMSHTPLANVVLPYSVQVNGSSVPLELVPVTYDDVTGLVENRPYIGETLTVLYGTDGLGDSSDTTGFFFYTKQGTLQRFRTTFDGVTPNQTYTVSTDNINDTDVWLNEVDPVTGSIIDNDNIIATRKYKGKSGEWIEVDAAHSENIIFNTNPFRNKFEVETLADNQIRLNFGDGNFANIPSGTFDVWIRSSINDDLVIPQSAVSNQSASLTYVDQFNRTQTLTFTFTLISSLQNGSAAETDEHLRLTAPAVYYTQDRMVNGEDYNSFPLKDSSILKLRTINRDFVGNSRYVKWEDATGSYDDVNIFSNDGVIYLDDITSTQVIANMSYDNLITQHIEPLLSTIDIFMSLTSAGVSPTQVRRTFTAQERSNIVTALTPPPLPNTVYLYFNVATLSWSAFKASDVANLPTTPINYPLITIDQGQTVANAFTISWTGRRFVLYSPTTMFWTDNDGQKVVDYNTLNTLSDTINVLQANVNCNRSGLLTQNWKYNVLGVELVQNGPDAGTPDINRVGIIPTDQFGFPSGTNPYDTSLPYNASADLMVVKLTHTIANTSSPITLPINYINSSITGVADVKIVNASGVAIPFNQLTDINGIGNQVMISSFVNAPVGSTVTITVNDYVYMNRDNSLANWNILPESYNSMVQYIGGLEVSPSTVQRKIGRYNINFAWLHSSSRYDLVDPTPTNINDMFVITKGYYINYRRWLENAGTLEPDLPTPFDLRLTYQYLFDNKMISDTVVLHPGKFKLLFGPRATPQLQGRFKVIRSENSTLTDNQIKNQIVTTTRQFFDVTQWEFGETFYFEELATAIQMDLVNEISSIVFVPTFSSHYFGDGYEVVCKEDEVFYCDISNSDIDIVLSYTPANLKQVPDKIANTLT